jgi:hypothetical protein
VGTRGRGCLLGNFETGEDKLAKKLHTFHSLSLLLEFLGNFSKKFALAIAFSHIFHFTNSASSFFLQTFWQPLALDALRVWVIEDNRVEETLTLPHHVHSLVRVFESANDTDLPSICECFSKIIHTSAKINRAVGRCGWLCSMVRRLEKAQVC